MTALHTHPIPISALDPHEHGWEVESRHVTSDGTVLYVLCTGCGARRVDVHPHPQLPPIALSITAPARGRLSPGTR